MDQFSETQFVHAPIIAACVEWRALVGAVSIARCLVVECAQCSFNGAPLTVRLRAARE